MELVGNDAGASLRPDTWSGRSTYIASGEDLFHRFCEHTGLNTVSSISFFDHHNVVDTIEDKNDAEKIGIALSHLDDHGSVLLSYSQPGSPHRENAFERYHCFFPMINELDGYIFIDFRDNANSAVHVYQEDWMKWNDHDDKGHLKCSIIGVAGDKGQIAELFGIPAIIFDDKENNVRKVMQAGGKNAGCVVRLGSKMGHEVRRQTRLDRKFLELTNHYDLFLYSQYFRNHVQRPYCTAISAIAHSQ